MSRPLFSAVPRARLQEEEDEPSSPSFPQPAPPPAPVAETPEMVRLRALSRSMDDALRESALAEERARERAVRAERESKRVSVRPPLPPPTVPRGDGHGAGAGAGDAEVGGVLDRARASATEFVKKLKIGVPLPSLLQKYGLGGLSDAEGEWVSSSPAFACMSLPLLPLLPLLLFVQQVEVDRCR